MAWEQITGNSAGPMNGDGSRKLTIHSTEGHRIEDAVAAYRMHNSWATLTVDARARRVARHLQDTVAARSLQNTPGGADQTNKDGTVHIQIELVGFAADPGSFGTDEDLEWFGRDVVGPLCRRHAIPIATSVTFKAYRSQPPSSYGRNNGVRLSPAEWDSYSGVLGHMHVPDNTHGDPGALLVGLILTAARGDDDVALTDDQKAALGRIDEIDTRTAAIFKLLTDEGDIGRRSKETTIAVRALLARDGDVDEAEIVRLLVPQLLAGLPLEEMAALFAEAVPAEQAEAAAQAVLDALAVRIAN